MFSKGGHLGDDILNFIISSKPPKITKFKQKVSKSIKKHSNDLKTLNSPQKRGKCKILKKNPARNNVVTKETQKFDEKGFAILDFSQINFWKSHQVWWL